MAETCVDGEWQSQDCSLTGQTCVNGMCLGVQPVTEFEVTDPGVGNLLDLSWVNSETASANFVRVIRFVGTCVDNPDPAQFDRKEDLSVVSAGQPQSWTDDQIEDNVEYCYAAFAKSVVNYSSAAFATGTSTDVTPPQAITDFTVTPSTTPGDLAMDLSWTNLPETKCHTNREPQP